MSRGIKIGDKGQRFVVRTLNWPILNEWANALYCETEERAKLAFNSLLRVPDVLDAQIVDREMVK